ncbi:amino acid adenylation domain-containing protein [Nocardia sp. 004]|uniref:amino acid adenylation domain-containing protein n=1 Tax=Nocardia sp. 004 TaxID=3385978 RepID=UPI0039A1AF3F
MTLQHLVSDHAARTPQALAVAGPDGELTYRELHTRAEHYAARLHALGVRRGDRVALWMVKSTETVALMQGVLRSGAAYVPLDPTGPLERARIVIADCRPRLVLTDAAHATMLTNTELDVPVRTAESLAAVAPDALVPWAGRDEGREVRVEPELDDLAYILYTSGSTGTPKGVCLSHRNALAFIDWAAAELAATEQDRFSNHAPFHFDLSVLDLYVAFATGASVHLISEGAAYSAPALVRFLSERRITVWYSVPSALVLMAQYGGLLTTRPEHLRAVLFAGEPYPLPHARALRAHLPLVRMLNLYGPTETNVCLFHEVGAVGTQPLPIGVPCSGDKVSVVCPDGTLAEPGEVGELVVEGPSVMLGYWGRRPLAGKPYATGDLVVHRDGVYHYRGRKDSMVKIRGHRVELGEIDTVLHTCPGIAAAAAIVAGAGLQARLIAFVVADTAPGPTLLEIKTHCARHLPPYMIIDEVRALDSLPRTSTGKTDRRRLGEMVQP